MIVSHCLLANNFSNKHVQEMLVKSSLYLRTLFAFEIIILQHLILSFVKGISPDKGIRPHPHYKKLQNLM